MTRRGKIGLGAVAALPVLLYAGLVAYFVQTEESLVYMPSREIRLVDPALAEGVRAVPLTAEDGTRLSARVLPAHTPARQWVFLLPANGGNASTHQHWWRIVNAAGAHVFTLDYRGYGESEGTPSEAGLYADATAGYRYLADRERIAPADIILYGFSLGSAVAIDLASRVPVGGVIVEGAMSSIPQVGQEQYPFLPVSLIARNHFDSLAKIARVTAPKLFLHARDDRRVPFRHSERLFEVAVEPKALVPLNGDHTTAARLDEALIITRVRAFLESISAAGRTSS